MKTRTNTQVYDTSREIPSDVAIPTMPSVRDIDFKPASFVAVQLAELVGEVLQTTGDSRTEIISSIISERQREKTRTQPQLTAKEIRNSDKPSSINAQNFIALQTFMQEKEINAICATSHNQVWVQCDKELHLLNDNGKTQKTKKMDVGITDFCVSPTSGHIWFCSDSDNSVRKLTGDKLFLKKSTLLFNIETTPISICISADGNILVGMERQIVKYSQRGQLLCKSTQVKHVPVISYPDCINSCPVTRNIAVVDWDYKDCGGDDKPHVAILREDLQLLCTYYGRDMESFCPRNVCYSNTGDIYIADSNNNSIQQVSGSGKLIRTVYADSEEPATCLCVQANGDIWAVFGDSDGGSLSNEITILQ